MTGFTFLGQAPSLTPTWKSFLLMPAAMILLLFFEANVFPLCALTVKLNYLKGKCFPNSEQCPSFKGSGYVLRTLVLRTWKYMWLDEIHNRCKFSGWQQTRGKNTFSTALQKSLRNLSKGLRHTTEKEARPSANACQILERVWTCQTGKRHHWVGLSDLPYWDFNELDKTTHKMQVSPPTIPCWPRGCHKGFFLSLTAADPAAIKEHRSNG